MSEVKIEERKKNQTISHKADKIMSIIDIVLCHDRYPFWPPPPWCFLKYLGDLKVLEPRFNVESLALLLNIPPNKTLLRRHLATHFHLLIGSEAQRLKQDCLENPDYTVLTATAKVKVPARPPPHKPWSLWPALTGSSLSAQLCWCIDIRRHKTFLLLLLQLLCRTIFI